MTSMLHPLIAERWSPRAFDPVATLSAEQAERLLEAARWAPSAANTQPWRFLLADRGSAAFATLFDALMPGNQLWAGNASALLLVASEVTATDGSPLPWATYDTGQAVAALSTQAQHDGLATHQMGGFDRDSVARAFGLPAWVQPLVVIAIGVRASADSLPEPLAARETAPRTRRPLEEIVLRPGMQCRDPQRRAA